MSAMARPRQVDAISSATERDEVRFAIDERPTRGERSSACTPLVSSGSSARRRSLLRPPHPLTSGRRPGARIRFPVRERQVVADMGGSVPPRPAQTPVAWRGTAPGWGHAPSMSGSRLLDPSSSRKLMSRGPGRKDTAGRRTSRLDDAGISPPVAAIAAWIVGGWAPSRPSIAAGSLDIEDATVRWPAGAAGSNGGRPVATASRRRPPRSARSVVAENEQSHAASTTGQSARSVGRPRRADRNPGTRPLGSPVSLRRRHPSIHRGFP